MRAIIFDYFGVLASSYGLCDPGMVQFIEQDLRGKYKLAVLSNMSSGTAEEMLGPHKDLFDKVALSGNLGYSKPDTRAFLKVASQLEEFPSDCIMIDDSQSNCAGARQSDMEAIHYTTLVSLKQALAKYDILTS